MTIIAGHTTRAAGTVLTAAIYNTDHNIHIANAQALNSTKLEGATPPVVDGQLVVWNGTSGAALRSGGFAPIPLTRTITAGTGLTGGGDLSANRTLAVDFASQSEAETATSAVDVMNPLVTKQQIDFRLSNLATAQAGTDNTKLMTPLRVMDEILATLASQAEAEAGVNAVHLMNPLRTAQAIAALGSVIDIGSAVTGFSNGSPWDTGADDALGAVFLVQVAALSVSPQISLNGGTNYTSLGYGGATGSMAIVFVKGGVAASIAVTITTPEPYLAAVLSRVTPTVGAGNIFFKTVGAAGASGLRVM